MQFEEGRHQVEREGEDDGRVLLGGDFGQGLEVAKLEILYHNFQRLSNIFLRCVQWLRAFPPFFLALLNLS